MMTRIRHSFSPLVDSSWPQSEFVGGSLSAQSAPLSPRSPPSPRMSTQSWKTFNYLALRILSRLGAHMAILDACTDMAQEARTLQGKSGYLPVNPASFPLSLDHQSPSPIPIPSSPSPHSSSPTAFPPPSHPPPPSPLPPPPSQPRS